MDELTLDPAISASMEALGISQNLLDADETPIVEAENTEVEAQPEASSEGEASEDEEGDETEVVADSEEAKPEGEETQEAPVEEPKLTAKEFQELNAAREQLELDRKALIDERQAVERELQEKYHDKVKLYDELDAFLVDLEAKDSDLYGLIKSQFAEYNRQFNNPVIAKTREEIQSLKAELNQFKSQASAEVTLSQVKADTDKLMSTLGKDAEAAGIKLDIAKVKDVWAKNPGLSLEQAAWVEYGPSLMKASASKAKVEAIEKKVAARPAVKTAGSVSRSTQPVAENIPSRTEDAVRFFAKQFTGRTYT